MLAYSVEQCFPTFLQLRHTYLEPVTSRHTAAFMAQISELRLKYTHKIPTKFQIHIWYSGWSVPRQICGKWKAFNESWQLHWNFPLKTFDFRHSAAAQCYHSHGTLVCRGTQVGKHCPTVWLLLCGFPGYGSGYDDIIISGSLAEQKFVAYYTK